MSRRARVALAAVPGLLTVLCSLAGAAPAGADDVSAAEYAEIARLAAQRADPARLASVTSVEGSPIDVAAALEGARGTELQARLQLLAKRARDLAPQPGAAARARTRAEEIVEGFPEEEAQPPPPTGGSDGVGGIDLGSLWIPLLAAAIGIGLLLAGRIARNREAAGRLSSDREDEERSPLRDIEAELDAAERRQDYSRLIRLRFAQALGGLERGGVVHPSPSLTPARVAATLGDRRARALVATFERVVYGRQQARADDAERARDDWAAIVAERARR